MASRPWFRSLNLFRRADRARQFSGWRKALDTVFGKIGPSWQAAPVRRTIQAACLLLYCHLFFHVSWPYAALFSSQVLSDREWLPVETFLWIDPLVGLSTAIAVRWWNVALIGMAAVLVAELVFPRGFCGYLCPLGTLIDLFDFLVGKRIPWFKTQPVGRWSNMRFYLLAAVLAGAVGGVLLSGFVAAIPVLTRGLLFSAGNVQLGLAKNWGMVPPLTGAVWLSLSLFAVVFLLSLFGPRYWCRHVCPSGALLSLPSGLRRFQRQVDDRCIACGKCIEVCPFDAIQPDFGTRILNCTFCQTCGGSCPTEAIHFVPLSTEAPRSKPDVTVGQPLTRRAMLGCIAGGAAAALLTRFGSTARARPIRPPGSVPEEPFLDLCIRCEQCIKVCPGPVLQAAGWEHGFEALWTPVAVFPHAGCHQDCNFCTQVCPTGAIQPLTLADKRRFLIGLAVVDTATCLPHRGERDCQFCFDECNAAGYCAIEMRPIQLATGPVPEGAFSPEEIEQMGRILAPFVKAEACVGCGLCEYRCQSAWVSQQELLQRSAVVVQAR
jgi:ferredoxin